MVLGVGGVAVASSVGGEGHPDDTARSSGPAAPSATLTSAQTKLGLTLVDANDRTLYVFEMDSAAGSSCYAPCAYGWPPVSLTAAARTAGNASTALLGAIRRTEGDEQITYHGHPLYYYVRDARPGDTNGQSLNQFGSTWHGLTPSGNEIGRD